MAKVLFPSLEMWAVPALKSWLATRDEPFCQDVTVLNVEPPAGTPLKRRMVILRDDSGLSRSIVSAERSLSVSTLAGTKENPKDADDLSRYVHAFFADCAGMEPGNPVAAVTESFGPYAVPEAGTWARRLSTFDLVVVGREL